MVEKEILFSIHLNVICTPYLWSHLSKSNNLNVFLNKKILKILWLKKIYLFYSDMKYSLYHSIKFLIPSLIPTFGLKSM